MSPWIKDIAEWVWAEGMPIKEGSTDILLNSRDCHHFESLALRDTLYQSVWAVVQRMHSLKIGTQDFSGHPVVKTLNFHSCKNGFNPGHRLRFHMPSGGFPKWNLSVHHKLFGALTGNFFSCRWRLMEASPSAVSLVAVAGGRACANVCTDYCEWKVWPAISVNQGCYSRLAIT